MERLIDEQKWYHSNKYTAGVECEHCRGVIRHEHWCIAVNREVAYAYSALLDPAKLSFEDQLILHALGVAWTPNRCEATCTPAATRR